MFLYFAKSVYSRTHTNNVVGSSEWQESEGIVEHASAMKDGRGEGEELGGHHLETPEPRTRRVRHLEVEIIFAEGENGDE